MERTAIPEEKIDFFKSVFEACDSNKDGVIEKEDLANLARACGLNPTEAEVTQYMDVLDENKNGVVDFEEFVRFAAFLFKEDSSEVSLRQAFNVSSWF